jgi:hypothetical protein
MEKAFSVGCAPSLYKEDPRLAEVRIEGVSSGCNRIIIEKVSL